MPFDGNGNYVLPSPAYPAVSGALITAANRNAIDADLQSALSNCVTRDGQSPPTANLPMGAHKLTGLTPGNNTGDSVAYEQLAAILPPGTLFDYAGAAVPAGGFLACDGSAVSRVVYAALFTAVGTTWGAGDGATTFNLPDFRGRAAIGAGAGGGLTNRVLGTSLGEENHVLSVAELAAHSHVVTDPGHTHTVNDPGHTHNLASGNAVRFLLPGIGGGANYTAAAAAATADATTVGGAATGVTVNAVGAGVSINNSGSGNGHNNMQPSAVVTKIIKT